MPNVAGVADPGFCLSETVVHSLTQLRQGYIRQAEPGYSQAGASLGEFDPK